MEKKRAAMSLVQLENAGIMRAGRWLVRGITLTIKPGEIVMLIGPNGSGKSSTAKMALGTLIPSVGRASRRPGLRVGYVPQKFSIDWILPLSVARFMELTGPLTPTEKMQALARVEAAHLLQSQLAYLSGGEFQRVMLARAAARRPDLLILDEPVQGVDALGQARLYELILTLRNELSCGVLLISHDLHVVMAAADLVICLNGHICCQGPPYTISEDPSYQALFGGYGSFVPPTLALYPHLHDHTHTPDGRICSATSLASPSSLPLTSSSEKQVPLNPNSKPHHSDTQ